MKPVLIVIASLLFISCSRKASSSIETNGTPIQLAVNETASFNGVTISVTAIKESRCPMNARCIRAGEAIAAFSISDKKNSHAFSLCTGADCRRLKTDADTTVSLSGRLYKFALEDITPNPTLTLEAGRKKAVFTVKKAG